MSWRRWVFDRKEKNIVLLRTSQAAGAVAGGHRRGGDERPRSHSAIIDPRDRAPDVPWRPPDVDDDLGGFAGDVVDEWGR